MTCGGGHLGFQIITKNTNLIRDHSMIFMHRMGSFSSVVFKKKIFSIFSNMVLC